jgi:hypothetical protein
MRMEVPKEVLTHPIVKYDCEFCTFSSAYKFNRKRHMMLKHPDKDQSSEVEYESDEEEDESEEEEGDESNSEEEGDESEEEGGDESDSEEEGDSSSDEDIPAKKIRVDIDKLLEYIDNRVEKLVNRLIMEKINLPTYYKN